MGRRRWCGLGVARSTPLASAFLPCYSPAVPLVVTCAQCREEVLEADLIGDEEECALRSPPCSPEHDPGRDARRVAQALRRQGTDPAGSVGAPTARPA